MGALSDAAKSVQNHGINFSGICLPGNIVRISKSHLFADLLIEFNTFIVIALEKFHEAGLCAGCTFTAEELKGICHMNNFFKIENKILKPK